MKKLLSYFKLLSLIALLGTPMAYGMQENSSPKDNKIIHQTESWMENNDILKLLTAYLYAVNDFDTRSFGKDINYLTQVNKALNNFYSNEQMAKIIVSKIAELDKYATEDYIARDLLPTGVFEDDT